MLYDDETASTALDDALRLAADAVYSVNHANGWFTDNRTFGDEMMLIVTEAAEAMEEFRDHGFAKGVQMKDGTRVWAGVEDEDYDYPESDVPGHLPKPLGVASECADILVRLLDTCWRHDIDLGAEFRRKLAYNATRGFRHGGKSI